MFLDGEEAFVEWTKDDSIYGARHLANVYKNTLHINPTLSRYLVNILDALVSTNYSVFRSMLYKIFAWKLFFLADGSVKIDSFLRIICQHFFVGMLR